MICSPISRATEAARPPRARNNPTPAVTQYGNPRFFRLSRMPLNLSAMYSVVETSRWTTSLPATVAGPSLYTRCIARRGRTNVPPDSRGEGRCPQRPIILPRDVSTKNSRAYSLGPCAASASNARTATLPKRSGTLGTTSLPTTAAELQMPASLAYSFRPLLRGRGRRSAPPLPSHQTHA